MPYEHTSELLLNEFSIYLSPSWIQSITEKVGAQAHYDRLSIFPEQKLNEKELCLVQIDGSHIPMLTDFKEAKTLVIGTLNNSKERPEIKNRSYYATRGYIDDFTNESRNLIRKYGLKPNASNVLVMGDGAAWIWLFYRKILPNGIQILDFFHVSEHISEVIKIICNENEALQKELIAKMCHEVKHSDDGANKLITLIDEHLNMKSFTSADCDTLKKNREYFRNNQKRMLYKSYQEKGYPIGTGLVESTQKWLLQARLKRAGIHWSQNGANYMIALQVMIANKFYKAWYSRKFGRL